MPTVLRIRGYRFFFYADERSEPPHVHVEFAERDAKLWLDSMSFAFSHKFTTRQRREIIEIANRNLQAIRKVWDEFHSGRG